MKRVLLLVPMVALLVGADTPKKATPVPETKVTADGLRWDYTFNAAYADGLYLHKRLEVTGTMTRITKDLREDMVPIHKGEPYKELKTVTMYVMEMESPPRDLSRVKLRFFFPLDQRKELAALRRNARVTVTGFCLGILGFDVIFSDCKIVAVEEPEPRFKKTQP
jgi:hypothetical protein